MEVKRLAGKQIRLQKEELDVGGVALWRLTHEDDKLEVRLGLSSEILSQSKMCIWVSGQSLPSK